MESEQITISLAQAARISGISAATLRRMCLQNQIKHVRLKNGLSQKHTYLIFLEEIRKMLQPYDPRPPKVYTPARKPGRPESISI